MKTKPIKTVGELIKALQNFAPDNDLFAAIHFGEAFVDSLVETVDECGVVRIHCVAPKRPAPCRTCGKTDKLDIELQDDGTAVTYCIRCDGEPES